MTGEAAGGAAVAGPTVGTWRRAAAARIAAEGPTDASPALEADLLLMHATGLERTALWARPERTLAPGEASTLEGWLARRLDGEPVAYLTGRREFGTRDFVVRPGVLVPRPETELLVELALEAARARAAAAAAAAAEPTVLELGSGSGIVGTSIAEALVSEGARAFVAATDIDPTALEVSGINARRAVALVRASWLAAIGDATVDVLVSNPPYVRADDPHLAALSHEPARALVSGPDGLDAIRAILADARRVLRTDGVLLLEHGHDQGQAVRQLMTVAGLAGAFTRRDLAGRERVSGGLRPRGEPGEPASDRQDHAGARSGLAGTLRHAR